MLPETPTVLVVDDCEEDALLMRIVFERAGFLLPPQFVVDGDEAIAYLQGDGRYRDRAQHPLPSVILMDLNMPGKDGFEVLEWIRAQPAFKRLHVYILSASNRTEDIERAYDLGANSYLVKPGTLAALEQMASRLGAWMTLSRFAQPKKQEERDFVRRANRTEA